jgi:streptomycin 6-kinase
MPSVVEIPDAIGWWGREPAGAAWLRELPSLVAHCAGQWGLEVGTAFHGGVIALTLAATRADGREVVLKLRGPDPESEHEADALACWDGHGAVRVLERDDERRAVLLERLRPGSPLGERSEDEAADVVGRLLRELHAAAPVPPCVQRLRDVARGWAERLPARWERHGRPFEPELVELAVETFLAPPPTGAGEVLLHQDLHAGNVLLDRGRWRAIDPKPLLGEPAFDGAAILRDRHWTLPVDELARLVPRRLERLAGASGYDRERLRRWGIAHTLAWGVDDEGVQPGMIACARALLAAG